MHNEPHHDERDHEVNEPEESFAARLGWAAAVVVIGVGALVMLTG